MLNNRPLNGGGETEIKTTEISFNLIESSDIFF